ncbi:MAG: 16S rRNA processing protein RimM [Bacteroidales bacterium]|nr:16S rRNA processing protein RimM [Bacteroidales bacterium]
MKKEECFYLGKIIKPFGFKGELVLFLDVDDIYAYEDLPYVYIDINKRLIKYDIDTFRYHGNKVVVTFADVQPDESAVLVGKEMYLPLEFLPKLEGNQFYFHEVIGFEVIDKQKGSIGTLKEIIDNTTQPLMSIDCNGKEVLMPLIDEILDKVDRDNEKIYINAPEGLIDIYLE